MLDFEYCLFTSEDPIEKLKSEAKSLPFHKKLKIAPYIRRAQSLTTKCKKFRDIIIDENNTNNIALGFTFASYFGEKLDKHQYLCIPSDVPWDYLSYVKDVGVVEDDKYMKKVTALILSHSDSIDAFVKAFLSIRLAQGKLDKLK